MIADGTIVTRVDGVARAICGYCYADIKVEADDGVNVKLAPHEHQFPSVEELDAAYEKAIEKRPSKPS